MKCILYPSASRRFENGRRHEIKLIHYHGFIITTSAQTGEARPKNMHEHIAN